MRRCEAGGSGHRRLRGLHPGWRVEVGQIAAALAALDPATPYRLLAFHPDYVLNDLPSTPRVQAEACAAAARAAGLTRVSLGNLHLLR